MRKLDLTDIRFGRLVAKYVSESSKVRMWVCQCDCGGEIEMPAARLRSGTAISCGCIARTHGASSGIFRTKTYMVWDSMLSRCRNPKHHAWDRYGGRGIGVCERWIDFSNFLEDMGEKKDGESIDRINNDLGYSKENCRWTTVKAQSRNRSSNRIVMYKSVQKTIIEWSEILGWPHHLICSRLREGWSDMDALTRPRRYKDDDQNEIINSLDRSIESAMAYA